MDAKIKIAVCGLDVLASAGVRHIACGLGLGTVRVDTLADTSAPDSDAYDMYVATPESFALAPDFFMLRRDRLVVAGRFPTATAPLPLLGPSTDETAAADLFETVLRRSLERRCTSGHLSHREAEVLRQVASGLTNKEIADRLNISASTVITHRKNITAKLGIKSVSGLSLYAMMNGLV